ncbi:MAG TPA: gamma-glutamyl-gamma-aminobutyrate hydrolase family protein [Fimbriimonas sp.]|nr:gamma-glutamyl-gamma-aminobutyrate hydrolase family protein [Fimbriimonas sp.]
MDPLTPRPLVGISVDCKVDAADSRTQGSLTLNWNYAQAVTDAGGTPILIPPQANVDDLKDLIDGWLIPGGNDICASNWGEENHPEVETIEQARFDAEKRMYAAIDEDLPVLGICYGCQFINVARGGSLLQHLPDVIGHDQHRGGTLQDYAVDPNSKLAGAISGSTIAGKSYHHQAVERTGEGLRVVAKDEEGTIEAIEATDRPFMLGVQWHPERTLEDEATQRLFKSFVQAAADYRAKKGK